MTLPAPRDPSPMLVPVPPLRLRYLPTNCAWGVFFHTTLIQLAGEPLLYSTKPDAEAALAHKKLMRGKTIRRKERRP